MYFRYNAVSFSVSNYFWMMAFSMHKKEKKNVNLERAFK